MKTLTKILTVVALVALCVCLFTLTAFAETTYTIEKVYEATEGTCYKKGYVTGFLLDNGKYYKGELSDEVKAAGEITSSELAPYGSGSSSFSLLETDYKHNMDTSIKYDPETGSTCKVNAKEFYECQDCHKHFKDAAGTQEGERTSALAEHTPGPVTEEVKETCGKDGSVAHSYCKVCGALLNADGKEIATDVIPATGAHNWGDWIILKEPTNVSPGQKMRVCIGTAGGEGGDGAVEGCGAVEYAEIPADGISEDETPWGLWYVVPTRDAWLRGEEAMTFRSNLVEKLNNESGKDANFVGVRIGTDSLYENSYDTFDFWSWGEYIKLGDKTMAGLEQGKYRIWVYDKRYPKDYTCSCEFWVVDVPTLEPYSTDKHVVNSSKSLRFVASDEIDPDSVKVGSKRLYDSSDYFVSNDRKNITLSAEFLNNRQTGTYTISARTTDGRTIKTNFYILTTAQASSSPRTGDESQIGLWAAFLLLSGAAVVVLVPKLRKQGVK